MAAEEYKELHKAIAEGNLELVRGLLQDNYSAEKYFLYEGNSALFNAFSNKKYNIASHLIRIGAKFDDSEDYDSLDIDLDLLNCLLMEYNRKPETSSIFRLISCSQSPQGLEGERLTAVISMYENLFKSEIMKWLMKVVESVALDIVFDFESEDVNRIHRLYEEESEIYGLTLTCSKEIFIGAKGLLSDDSQKSAKVYGVVAEELCHLALTDLFENDAKPYREGDLELENDFKDIVLGMKSSLNRSCHTESVIMDVFKNYERCDWECELVARIPHVIGLYGEESARRIFQESHEFSRLLRFYEENVIPKCEMFADPSLNTKTHRIMKELREKNALLSYKEKTTKPLKQGFPSFREFSVDEEGISVVTTNCVKLCTLQVYHELKMQYKDLFEKKCLFFSRKCLDDKWSEILNALKVKVYDYFILILGEKEITLQRLKREYLDHFDLLRTRGMKIVVILGSQPLGDKFQRKALNYEWKDLSSEYQHFRTHPLIYVLNGEEHKAFIEQRDVPKFFSREKDILMIISGEHFVIEDGAELESQGFILETYLDREFKVMAVNKSFLENLFPDTSIFIYGLNSWNLKELSIDETVVQWVSRYDDEIQRGKIHIIEDEKVITFSECKRKNLEKRCICLHFIKNEFILRNADSLGEVLNEHKKEIRITEEQTIDLLKKKRILIISDNAGCGKSTVTSSLVRRVRKNIYDSRVFRINLWKFSSHDGDFNFENSDDEDLFDEIFQMIGVRNGFERWYFRKSWNQETCFIFFDGYDEIPSKYKSKALELILYLRRNTSVNIVITARRHEQQGLEERLNMYSHQLVPFNDEEQVNCLGRLLKWKLKYPYGERDDSSQRNSKAISWKIKNIIEKFEKEESKLNYQELLLAIKNIELVDSLESVRLEIDKLDMTKLVMNILKISQLEKVVMEFMGIPLHLYMVGSILYEDNFNLQIGSDIYSLYNKFIDQKILIYIEEKEGHLKEGNEKDRMFDRVREDAFKIHIPLANQLFDEGKAKVTKVEQKDIDLCSSLGIVSIHGGEILFLHQTFAEFFKAESIRKNIEKDCFLEMLSEKKYEVVRRFLLSVLEKTNFENLPKEFFKDVNFLVRVMKKFCDLSKYNNQYRMNSDFICCLKIMKKLLQEFTLSSEPILFQKFIRKLNKLVKDKKRKAISIGGCLTIEIMKHLMNRNFNYNSILILYFVGFSESVEDVIEVMEEIIFKEHVSRRWCKAHCLFRRENRDLEERVLDRILELLRIKDSNRYGLISYTIRNERSELFPQLLKYFREVLGKDQFETGLIKSFEYRWQIKWSAGKMHTNANCRLIRGMHSVFGSEMDILFDNDFKFNVIVRSVENEKFDERSNLFENVINLFIEYFGNENLKEVLLSKEFEGEHLIHKLMENSVNTNLMKYLDVINNILGDEMKKFLKSKNRCSENIFHFAACSKNDLDFDFLNLYLHDSEIKELLFEKNENGWTCLHFAARRNLRKLSALLNYVFKVLNSDESCLEKLILAKDENGNTFLHLLDRLRLVYSIIEVFYKPKNEIIEIFNLLRTKLSDDLFKKLSRVRNKNEETFLQVNGSYKEEHIECYKKVLERDLFEELL